MRAWVVAWWVAVQGGWLQGGRALQGGWAGGWRCPELSARPAAECSCDLPQTLRCAGDHTAIQIIGKHLRSRDNSSAVSLLDCSLRGVSVITSAAISELAAANLQGLVLSSGDVRRIQQGAFDTVSSTLLALGLPNNQLPTIPTESLARLPHLQRFDLSNNKINTLDSDSFKGLRNLTYLDLSDNQLTEISSDAFKPLISLTVLRLRGNLLKVSSLQPLVEARALRDLDLSSNALTGPLGPSTVPALKHLVSLQLSDNTFASIRRGALFGLRNLTFLGLHNNQIDVLEDHAFLQLSNLTDLDLSHNEIVAVSGSSLAHLTNLIRLDLSHNFLRSLSAEPFKSLKRLADLLLHDNDISMIDDGALMDHKGLRRLTIEDNPLNCDCLMASFARWLREAKNLSQADQSAAICATPPHLEGALLSRLSKNKLCDDPVDHEKDKKSQIDLHTPDFSIDYFENINPNVEEVMRDKLNSSLQGQSPNYVDDSGTDDDGIYDDEDMSPDEDLPISKAKVQLDDTWYAGEDVHMAWSILGGVPSAHYRCAGVTVSTGSGVLRHLACHKSDPSMIVIHGLKIQPKQLYTFCIAIEELESDTATALVLGCAQPRKVPSRPDIIHAKPVPLIPELPMRVSEVRSNVTSDGLLTVFLSLLDFPPTQPILARTQRLTASEARYLSALHNCYIVLAVLSRGSLVAQRESQCEKTLDVTMEGFLRGPYEVCASLSKFQIDERNAICVTAQFIDVSPLEIKAGIKSMNLGLIGLCIGLLTMVLVLVWFVRKMLKKPASLENHRCFRTEPIPEENLRASYVMLTATSKV